MNKLTISLDAISDNYHRLSEKAWCGAVVKANGYGLGAAPIAQRLEKEGCGSFFVATLEEAVQLRQTLKTSEIFVFHGAQGKECLIFQEYGLIPVLNNKEQLKDWPNELPAIAHFDTGMTRLGFSEKETGLLQGYNIIMLMSHLANAEDAANPNNKKQLDLFNKIGSTFPDKPKSLANSAGIFLDPQYHFELARPGIALYGGLNMNPVVTLTAPIIQIHEIIRKQQVGYGGDYTAEKGDIIGTIAIGYADGILRKLGNRGKFHVDGIEVPVVGRVSMDLITIKLNNLPPERRKIGELVEILGKNYTITDMADDAETIDYEIITRLGNRFERVYK